MKFRRPSPAMVIAFIAVFAALSGGAYAAKKITKLKKNSVTTKSIKNNAVTGPKIKDGSVGTKELEAAQTGTPAYAHVTYNGTTAQVDAAHSKNVTVAKSGTDDGLVCVDATVPVKMATPNPDN